MRIAAMIAQVLWAALTFVAVSRSPVGSYGGFAWAPFVVLACSAITVVALLRSLGRKAFYAVLALNASFILFGLFALGAAVIYNLPAGGKPFIVAVIATLIVFIPYTLSIIALWKRRSMAFDSDAA